MNFENLKGIDEKHTIFLLDDRETFHAKFEICLELLGIDTNLICVSSSTEALSIYESMLPNNKPDLLFLDINLDSSPINGLEVLRIINQELGNDVLICIISNSFNSDEMEKAIHYGANGYIVKMGNDLDQKLLTLRKHFFEDKNSEFLLLK